MEITYLGHASFRIKGGKSIILTDPYDPSVVGLKFPKTAADIVTVSHAHQDHNASNLVKNPQKVIQGPGEYEVAGISIIGISSFHDDKKGVIRGKNTIYIFEIEDKRIAHLGDLGEVLTETSINDLGNIDILMIPVGGEFTLGPKEAVDLVTALEPSIVIPMHYNIPQINQETFGKLAVVDEFLSKVGLTTEKADKLIVKGDLGEESKVVVLKPQNA